METQKRTLKVNDMVCESCEKIIEKSLAKLEGVSDAKASYANGIVEVSFDSDKVSNDQLIAEISEAGYHCQDDSQAKPQKKGTDAPKGTGRSNSAKEINGSNSNPKFVYLLLGLTAIAFLVFGYLAVSATIGKLNISVPQLDAQTSIVLIFFVGLLTGFHCIGMCGGFVLGYTAKAKKENPRGLHLGLHSKYAIGKLISYTLIGGIFGLIGSIFVFTPELRAAVAILAGIFLILFALRLLNVFPILRKFSLPQEWFSKLRIGPLKTGNSSPLVVGLMNGLFIACGPLQAMYVLAATTGSFLTGAAMLAAFAIGTLIPMMGFGVFASFMSHGFQNQIVRLSAVIVLVMGILMINNGLALTGNAFSVTGLTNTNALGLSNGTSGESIGSPTIAQGSNAAFQEIRMDVLNSGWSPNSFVLKKGVPVKWVINGKELNGCNSAIRVPSYNLQFNIKPGLQTIEFTPTQTGTIQWSCWMGMIQGTFIVQDDVGLDSTGKVVLDLQAQLDANKQLAATPPKTGGCGCGGNGGSSCH